MGCVGSRKMKKAPRDLKRILQAVQPTTFTLFGQLNAFNKNKLGFRAIIEVLDPDRLLHGIKVDEAVGLFDGKQIKKEFYQRQEDGTPVQNIDDLYRVAD
jgi:hypothetical protein